MNFAVEDVTHDPTARMRISSANHSAFREMIDQHPQTRTVTNTELRVGVSIPIVPGTMSTYKEYHEWVDLPDTKHSRLVDSAGDLVFGPDGEGSFEVIAANLFAKHATLTPMSTSFIEIPTLDATRVVSYDMAYNYQDAARARDPEGLTAQFSRPGRPVNASYWNRRMKNASWTVNAVLGLFFVKPCLVTVTVVPFRRPSGSGDRR